MVQFLGLILQCGMLRVFFSDFEVSKDAAWFNFATFPVFFGQVTASYEGIGTVSFDTFLGLILCSSP